MGRTSLLEVLNVRVVGTGDRFLVLSHGFGTDQSAWQKVLPYLVRDFRVVLYDLVCAGSVNPDNFDFARYSSLDPYVDDLLDVLAALRIERCAFVGHSISAMIGCLASIRRPELFTKLVLLGASPRAGFSPLRSPCYDFATQSEGKIGQKGRTTTTTTRATSRSKMTILYRDEF